MKTCRGLLPYIEPDMLCLCAGEELYVSVRDLGQGAFGLVRLAVNR